MIEQDRSYTVESIKVVCWKESIRTRPGMYVGDTSGGSGLVSMVNELLANALDQHIAGRLAKISVVLHADDSVTVSDDGPGIAMVADHEGMSPLECHMIEGHQTPTADGHAPHLHFGSVGLGLVVVSCLSKRVEVRSAHGGQARRQVFARGEAQELAIDDPEHGFGTEFRFWPDPQVFKPIKWDLELLRTRVESLALLGRGLQTQLQIEPRLVGPCEHLVPCLDRLMPNADLDLGPVIAQARQGSSEADAAFGWVLPQGSPGYDDGSTIESYCNFTRSIEGGSHVDGLKNGIRSAARVFARENGLTLDAKEIGQSALRGLYAVVSVKLLDPSYGSPTKDRLVSRAAKPIVRASVEAATLQALRARPEAGLALLTAHSRSGGAFK